MSEESAVLQQARCEREKAVARFFHEATGLLAQAVLFLKLVIEEETEERRRRREAGVRR